MAVKRAFISGIYFAGGGKNQPTEPPLQRTGDMVFLPIGAARQRGVSDKNIAPGIDAYPFWVRKI